MCILLFGVLWYCRKRIAAPGILFCLYLVLNGAERFFIEKIRVNATYEIFGGKITQAEIISAVLILVGAAGFYFLKRRPSAHET
jgi:prolipoprotein diacylglyceryltransferase